MCKANPARIVIINMIALMVISPKANCATLQEAKTLRADLLTGYDKFIRPIGNQSNHIDVNIGMTIIALQEFDEVEEKFSFVGIYELSWIDESMQWNASNYSGITQMLMGYNDIWVPEVILTNPSDKIDSFGDDWMQIRYLNSGMASWYPADLIKATCSINAYTFPFDTQECTVEVYIWAYLYSEARFVAVRDTINTQLMSEHGSWKLKKTRVTIDTNQYSSRGLFTFWFQRKPQYVIINIVLPILFLCLLNVLVFVLPPDSGERMSYSITVLLSIAVFMTIVSDNLPKTSEPLPLIAFFLMMNLISSSLIATVTVLNLRLHHKDDSIPVPSWLVSFYHKMNSCLTCTARCKRNRGQTTEFFENKALPAYATEIKIEPINKVAPAESQFHDADELGVPEQPVSWKDISVIVDQLSLIIFTILALLTFIIFFLTTATAS